MSVREHLNRCTAALLILLSISGALSFFTFQVNAQQTEIKVINPVTGDNTFKFYTNETGVGNTIQRYSMGI